MGGKESKGGLTQSTDFTLGYCTSVQSRNGKCRLFSRWQTGSVYETLSNSVYCGELLEKWLGVFPSNNTFYQKVQSRFLPVCEPKNISGVRIRIKKYSELWDCVDSYKNMQQTLFIWFLNKNLKTLCIVHHRHTPKPVYYTTIMSWSHHLRP